jgi:hypothetical protein
MLRAATDTKSFLQTSRPQFVGGRHNGRKKGVERMATKLNTALLWGGAALAAFWLLSNSSAMAGTPGQGGGGTPYGGGGGYAPGGGMPYGGGAGTPYGGGGGFQQTGYVPGGGYGGGGFQTGYIPGGGYGGGGYGGGNTFGVTNPNILRQISQLFGGGYGGGTPTAQGTALGFGTA